jgi:hypothetical protein
VDLRDLIVTPLFLLLIFGVAYVVRPYVTDEVNRKYFLPALSVKLLGALAVGFLYQFYYGGGDTFMYHTYGSRLIWQAFSDSPMAGLKLLFTDGKDFEGIYQYSSAIYFFHDPRSYAVIRLAAVFDLITFSTYSATACLFAVLSFIGAWQFYLTFYKQYPHLNRRLAVAAFFIPSVFFWGSGVLKDSVTLAFLGIATFQLYKIFVEGKFRILNFLILAVSLYVIFVIKIFILQAFLPAVILWLGSRNIHLIRSGFLRILVLPFMMGLLLISSYFTVVKVGEDDDRYSVSKIAQTAKVTAYDIRYQTGRDAGSGYSLGDLDGTFGSMARLAPQAINVALFRPYVWEVRNPLMFISALESLILFLFVLYVLVKKGRHVLPAFTEPDIIFSMTFAISFAFAVGIATYNFGTLARYKIPLLPFFLTGLILILDYSNRERKLPVLEETE